MTKVSGFRGKLYVMTDPSRHPYKAPGQDLDLWRADPLFAVR
jgi:hypothetical protein